MAESEAEDGYEELVVARNRKNKKAGGWQSFGLDHAVFKGIEKKGYRQPTPIQRKAIRPIIDGKDVVAMSRTGSGKTAAFVIPLLQKLKRRITTGTRALLISPTRELAAQTFQATKELGRYTGLRCALLVGGNSIEEQFSMIHGKPDIIVATPGRLLHLVVEMNLRLSSVQFLVFDEADRLFEMGFADQLHEVLKRLPENRQTLLFSATLPKILADFARAGLSDPMLVRLDVDEKISDTLSVIFLMCRADDKIAALLHLLRTVIPKTEQTIVFCATMKHVEYLVAILREAGIDCVYLYSQLDPVARKVNIQRFRSRQSSLLLVTDVAARGVDIPLLDNAINFHFPSKPKLFVHRVGRVARAGRLGRSYSLLSPDELPYLVDLFLFLGRPLNFARTDTTYKVNEPVVGAMPDHLINLEYEFLRTIHDNSDEMMDMRRKSENAMKKYNRTRSQPSAESVRRVKTLLKKCISEASTHPVLRVDDSKEESAREDLLRNLRQFRPQATIFEVNNGIKATSAAVMKEKRKAHERYLKDSFLSSEATRCIPDYAEVHDAEEADMVIRSSKFSTHSGIAAGTKKGKKRKADELKEEKREHFIAYAAADAVSERALAIDRGFDTDAKAHVIDISADDDGGLRTLNKRKKWDRRLMRFVGQSGDDPQRKKIRTEEGTLLPSSYKSGHYEQWWKKQKMQWQDGSGSDNDAGCHNDISTERGNRRGGHRKYRGRGICAGLSRVANSLGDRRARPELKNPDQILKTRRKKESIRSYQAHRRIENAKRRGGRSHWRSFSTRKNN